MQTTFLEVNKSVITYRGHTVNHRGLYFAEKKPGWTVRSSIIASLQEQAGCGLRPVQMFTNDED